MTTTETEAPGIPEPTFPHRAYGVDLAWLCGDEPGMIARGHVPALRFVAACNHYARVEDGYLNIWDDRRATLASALARVAHRWALPVDPAEVDGGTDSGGDFAWAVDVSPQITEATPGAIPVTVIER